MRVREAAASTVKLFLLVLPALLFAITHSSVTAQQQKVKEVKVTKAPIVQSDPASGKQMYIDYCAPCHGVAGEGNGPAAPALKVQPTNLSVLARNNSGHYPATRVTDALRFGTPTPAHGSKDMPVWGDLFHSLSASHGTERGESALRIQKLSDYVGSLQAK